MVAYVVEQLDPVVIANGSPLNGMALMSPFVWKDDANYRMMVRGVPAPSAPDCPTGVIGSGIGKDGLCFSLDAGFAIAPGGGPDDDDDGGCEDPTVLLDHGRLLVWYTGVDAKHTQSSLLLAEGAAMDALQKREVRLKARPGEGNIKEATLAQTNAGDWRMFYEYAAKDASRIGVASAPSPDGPWTPLNDPFTVRDDSWDNWHLSTGPIIDPPGGGDPVMFYNGATRDARWRIGWVSFSPDFAHVTGRGIEPVLMPPPPLERGATDIAFAASTVIEGDMIALYYSLEDRTLHRALIRGFQ